MPEVWIKFFGCYEREIVGVYATLDAAKASEPRIAEWVVENDDRVAELAYTLPAKDISPGWMPLLVSLERWEVKTGNS